MAMFALREDSAKHVGQVFNLSFALTE